MVRRVLQDNLLVAALGFLVITNIGLHQSASWERHKWMNSKRLDECFAHKGLCVLACLIEGLRFASHPRYNISHFQRWKSIDCSQCNYSVRNIYAKFR